jgi:thiol-disulfide isomerase/thioredoxin
MSKCVRTAGCIFLLSVVPAASAESLSVGDPAPKLQVDFIKGKPVPIFERGHVYALEFWATRCGPCKATIPHISELQKKHPKVTFIGVSIWEQNAKEVKPFVEKMGDKMDYRVAADSAGQMANHWMNAALQMYIPTAFIINGRGQVAWIGSPNDMEKPLVEIVRGTWNLKAAAAEFKREHAEAFKLRDVTAQLNKARGDSRLQLAILDRALRGDIEAEKQFGVRRLQLWLEEKQFEKAANYGRHMAEVMNKDAKGLDRIARLLIGPSGNKDDVKLAKLALDTARRADQVAQGKDSDVADALALALAANRQFAKAAQAEERALSLGKDLLPLKEEAMKKRLKEYQHAQKE